MPVTPGCRRCEKLAQPRNVEARLPDGSWLKLTVTLCTPCAAQASKENQAAKARGSERGLTS